MGAGRHASPSKVRRDVSSVCVEDVLGCCAFLFLFFRCQPRLCPTDSAGPPCMLRENQAIHRDFMLLVNGMYPVNELQSSLCLGGCQNRRG